MDTDAQNFMLADCGWYDCSAGPRPFPNVRDCEAWPGAHRRLLIT
jgi:hypothetical protein